MSQPATAARRSQLAAVHLAKKQLALTDESYRDLLERETGRRSAADLDESQLRQVLAAFGKLGFNQKKGPPRRAGTRRLAQGEQARKARALWLNLWHLAEVRSPEESALGAFVQRMTKRAAMEWCTPEQLNRVIEALKAWCQRAGVELPTAERLERCNGGRLRAQMEPVDESFLWQAAVIEAQWQRLIDRGAMRHGTFASLETWLRRECGVATVTYIAPDRIGPAVEKLGRWLRAVAAKQAQEVEPA